jgi:MFS family permease
MALLQLGAHVAIPFFTPYMLRTLRLELDQFALLVSVSILGKALSFPLWGRVASRFGLRPVLLISGLGVAAVPTLWTWVTDLWGLGAIQVLSGAVWAGVELASFQLLLESAEEELRLEFLSLQSSLAGVLALGGSLAGSALRERLGWDYTGLFLLSGLARLLPLLLLLRAAPRGVAPLQRWLFRILSVRPGGGAVREPALPLNREERPPAP